MNHHETLNKQVLEIRENGYTVVPQAFSEPEVQSLRAVFLEYFGEGDYINIHGGKSKPDFLKCSALQNTSWILANQKITELLKNALGEDILFCEHSDAHFNISNHWHKDVELPSANDPWNEDADTAPYRILKVALYLQPHESFKNYALKFKLGSHKSENIDYGEENRVTLKTGDAVVFDCRTTHMGHINPLTRNPLSEYLIGLLRSNKGNAKTLHDFRHREDRRPMQSLLNRMEYHLLRLIDKICGKPDRISLFYTFGVPNAHTQTHIENSKIRQDIQNGSAANDEPQEYKTHLKSVGIQY